MASRVYKLEKSTFAFVAFRYRGSNKHSVEVKPTMEEKLTILEIEQILGFDKIKPIYVSPGEQADIDEEGDVFREWYEQELREFYERNK
jgi:hypothetical protein